MGVACLYRGGSGGDGVARRPAAQSRCRGRDRAVAGAGLGVLFLYLYTASASEATAILFGNLLGVDLAHCGPSGVERRDPGGARGDLAAAAVRDLAPELADAKGVSLRVVSVLFLAIVAVAVAEAAQVVGVLLVFALMVGPAAALAAPGPAPGLGRGAGDSSRAVLETWGGLALAYATDWPTTFWIVLLSCLVYFASLAKLLPAPRAAPARG